MKSSNLVCILHLDRILIQSYSKWSTGKCGWQLLQRTVQLQSLKQTKQKPDPIFPYECIRTHYCQPYVPLPLLPLYIFLFSRAEKLLTVYSVLPSFLLSLPLSTPSPPPLNKTTTHVSLIPGKHTVFPILSTLPLPLISSIFCTFSLVTKGTKKGTPW